MTVVAEGPAGRVRAVPSSAPGSWADSGRARGRDCPAPQDVAVGQGCAGDHVSLSSRWLGGAVGRDDPPCTGAPRHGHRAAAETAAGVVATVAQEWPRPNDTWQINATCWALRSGTSSMWVMDILDDHSRLVVAAEICGGPDGLASWAAICDAMKTTKDPGPVMSYNGTCFTGRFFSGRASPSNVTCASLSCAYIRFSPVIRRPAAHRTVPPDAETLAPRPDAGPVAPPAAGPTRPVRTRSTTTTGPTALWPAPLRPNAGTPPSEPPAGSRSPKRRMRACTRSRRTTSSAGASTSSASGPAMSANACS